MSRSVPGGAPPEWPEPEPERGQGYGREQGAQGNGYDGRRGDPDAGRSNEAPYVPQYGYGHDQYGQYGGPPYGPGPGAAGAPGYGPPQSYGPPPSYDPAYNPARPNGAGGYGPAGQPGHNGQASAAQGQNGNGWGYADTQRQAAPGQYADTQRYQRPGQRPGQGPGQGPGGPSRPGGRRGPASGQLPPGRRVRLRRTRRFFRRRIVRVVSALLAVFLVLVLFSAGQTAFRNNGQGFSANLAEWARDHYLGPVVTFGEWLAYNPPKVGGKPSISLSGGGQAITSTKTKTRGKHKGFQPDIPASLKPLASGAAQPGEGQWRVIEKVKGEPAILTTRLRDGGLYTSYVNGIASIDQRLVRFSLRPGTEDPGGTNWGAADDIPAGKRTGLLATFNGGFKLDSAGGGFYLNGIYHGSLVTGAASVVYYKNGTMKVGEWGRDFTLNKSIVGVRQNLRLLIDHGKISPNLNQDIQSKFGATLGGGYYVWRSGLGITSGRPDRVRVRPGARCSGPGRPAGAGGRGRGHADGHQPGLDEVRLLLGRR